MALWATKRRFIYGGSVVLVLALVVGGIFWKIVYRAPTCSDGYKNGDEKGVDCGGSCKNLCTSDALNPIVIWSKIFNISGDVYSAVAFVENPNINSKNPKATYEFKIFDTNGKVITVKEGQTIIPKGKKFAIFETGIVLKGSKPKSADFQFISYSPWEKDTTKEPEVSLKYSTLLSTTTIPRITGVITNESQENIRELELSVFVLDGNENVVAASNSFIDNLTKKSSQDFVFTWPKPFNLGVETCIAPVDLTLALDKSGSMRSESVIPPEPFTTVINTAKNFVSNLKENDQVGVISFGTNPNQESFLSLNKQNGISAIQNLVLSTTTQENTNIAGGLTLALNELTSARSRPESNKVIILLTDGIPTEPRQAGVPDYPTKAAEAVAEQIKASNITIYTIGLGKNASESFLKSISTSEKSYFFAPTKETLGSIYSQINSSICQKKPNVITVLYWFI
jgi:hypothetical protein